jgi:putative alpha-1,2-mannosidase
MSKLVALGLAAASLSQPVLAAPQPAIGAPATSTPSPAERVNPLIGTANGGNVFPGATAPFGMVQFRSQAQTADRGARRL